MVINYSRLCEIEDPIDRIRKETKGDEGNNSAYGLGMLRQSIAALGNSFGADTSKDKITVPVKEKIAPIQLDKKVESAKKGYRSNGIFDTLFKPLEIKKEEPVETKKAVEMKGKPPSGKNTTMFGIVKDTTNYELESADDFFGSNFNSGPQARDRGTFAVSSPSHFQVSTLSNLEIINFYKDKPKDLVKLFHQIGTKTMNSKDNKGGKWISDIVKNFVTLLIYTAYSIEELEKLDKIKGYFALKIEKVIEEKKDCLRNIEALQEEIRNEQKRSEAVKDEERKARVRLMEKSTEFTVRMNELLNIKDERDQALQAAENSKKKLKEVKKVTNGFYYLL